MTTDEDNPYRSSFVEPKSEPRPKANVLRGFAYAVPATVSGFAIPFVLSSSVALVRYYFFGYLQFDFVADFREMPETLFVPGIGCAVVFGFGAILNYIPAMRMGFVRAVMFVGISALAGFFVMGVATVLFKLGPISRASDPWHWLRLTILFSTPAIYAVVHTAWLCRQISPGAVADSNASTADTKQRDS